MQVKNNIGSGILMLLIGCASNNSGAYLNLNEESCQLHLGVYYVQMKEISNPSSTSCGLVPDQRILRYSLDIPDGCTGIDMDSETHCSETMNLSCPNHKTQNVEITKGTLNYNHDASTATGIIYVSVIASDGTLICSSSYDTLFTRQ